MKKLFLLITGVVLFTACTKKQCTKKSHKSGEEKALLNVGGDEVNNSEFKYFYEKNNREDSDYSKESLDNYLKLFEIFKLKVVEAKAQGLDTLKSFTAEFEGYRKKLALPYLTEGDFNEKLAKEAHSRSKEEVRTSHILILLSPEADPADTLVAYNKLKVVLNQIKSGADFGEMAIKYSEDKSAQMEDAPRGYKGDLGYFSTLSLVYNYENAMYNTPVGKVSSIFRTEFGYHILKVTDRRESDGEITVAHILVRKSKDTTATAIARKKKKINDIYAELQSGKNWDDVCASYSEHEQTKFKGGKLSPFTKGAYKGIPEFTKMAFKLENTGDYSKPVETEHSWHIIKLINRLKNTSFEDVKKDYIQRVRAKPRAQLDKKALTQRLKRSNQFKEDMKVKIVAFEGIDESLKSGKWDFEKENQTNTLGLFTFNSDETYFVADFYGYVVDNQKSKPAEISLQYLINNYYDNYVAEKLLEYEESHLAEKHFDYKMLVQEYHDGILLFDLMKKDVWDKAQADTVALKSQYATNKGKYQWKERIEATVYTLRDAKDKEELLTLLAKGTSSEEIKQSFRKRSPLALQVKEGKYEKGSSPLIRKIDWSKNLNIIDDVEKKKTIVVVTKNHLDAGQKSYAEAKGLVISHYQDVLEKEWIKQLRKKHSVSVNQTEYAKLIK